MRKGIKKGTIYKWILILIILTWLPTSLIRADEGSFSSRSVALSTNQRAIIINYDNEIGAGSYYLVPLHDEGKPTMLINPIFYARTVGILQSGFEFAFALNQRHDMELISPLNTPFIMERQYNLTMFHAFMNMCPFQQWRSIAPYIGVAVGLLHLWDYRINQVFESNEELIISQPSFSLGGKIGVIFLPILPFRIFFEARFYLQPFPVNRPTYVNQGLGSEMAQMSEETQLNYFALGGGIKFAF